MAINQSDLPPANANGATLLARNVATLQAELQRLQHLDANFNPDIFLPVLLGTIHEGGFAIYDPEGKIISAWLPLEMQERLGLNTAELAGRHLSVFLPAAVCSERLKLVREAVQTGESRQHEYFAQFPTGGFWIQNSLAPLRNGDGTVRHIISFFRDITARKLAELSRDESEVRYRSIVENSQDAIMLTRPDGIIEYMSPSTLQVLGWPPEKLVGTCPMIVHPADRERVVQIFHGALVGESGIAYEYRILTPEGQVRWISHTWSPIMAGDKVKLIVSLVRDVTEQKRMEHDLRQSERLAAIGQTVTDIAHQLKTICLNIRGSTSLIEKALEENRPESLRALWGVFQRSSDRLSTLAIEMLEYAGLDTLKLQAIDLNLMARELHQDCVGKALRRNVALHLALDERVRPINGDRAKLGEVLLNLISNAIDACDERPIGSVEIRTDWDDPARQVRVQVSDNGAGIPPDVLSRIFDPFFTTKGSKGSGLGLAIAHKAVQLHGGAIEVESQPGHTRLSVILPVG